MLNRSIQAVPIFMLKSTEKGTFRYFRGTGQANNLIKMYN